MTTLRDALATAMSDNHTESVDDILAHPSVAAWLREQDKALVALADAVYAYGPIVRIGATRLLRDHADAIAAARERIWR